ncbi:hypothetical protein [Nitrospira defluvii]|uniref:DUF3102 domain-containing protein n=1 Tax=Nitrospira defluvii TaxID=330214 RepID=A0ABN7M693_9BACT|nr:hypothetical protein [Nitrospira defluvii]CAE6779519.1 conserved hypothetical protein [Nitrospira defluvii]
MTTATQDIVIHSSRISVLEPETALAPTDAIRTEIKSLAREVSSKFLRLSQLLRIVQRDGLYKRWGFDSFEAWIEQDDVLHPETARTFVAMEKTLVEEAKIPREMLADIGWTKAKALVPLQKTGRLAPKRSEILEKAKSLPTNQFNDYVQQVRVGAIGGPVATGGQAVEPSRRSVNFFLSADQEEAITTARRLAEQATGSLDPGFQLASICQDYVSSVSEDEAKAPDAWRARRVSMLLDVLVNHFGLVVEVQGAKSLEGQRILQLVKGKPIDGAPVM